MRRKIVSIQNLSRVFDVGEVQVKALDDISLEIFSGEITVILGPSGSGKTTLLNMIGGIDSPTSGELIVDDIQLDKNSLTELTQFRREKIGFIFQFFNLISNLTASENIEFIYEYVFDTKAKNTKEKIKKLLTTVGLDQRGGHFPFQLSGGEQQRVAIARALAKDPVIMLADEPTGELDHKTGLKILEALVSSLNDDRALIIVTHDSEIASIAHRTINLRDGKVLEITENPNPAQVSDLHW